MQQSSSVGTDNGALNTSSNDYHRLPVTEKQLNFARQISFRTGQVLPWETQQDRQALSRWIDENREAPSSNKFANYPSSKQVAFAERIARYKRSDVPPECFRDRGLMSLWIDSNK
ncbi:hypothetical protein BDE40_3589 [Litoreibacter halocynthiae]|uniref:Uncharacterized protein n=1 Tax=Litoreibacter halocynthiae TaxID=1242689 RepID=A0A4R7LEF5_9RHOB|nr:hypothetical protein [Litoreibacter halocynthiae]TDT72736.1 hypothetical protein BDE40_3589 [Litoreibacter halocynthiae]